jgi:hypothetical protein
MTIAGPFVRVDRGIRGNVILDGLGDGGAAAIRN